MPVNHKILPIRRVPNRRRRLNLGSSRQRRFLLAVKLLLKSLESTGHPFDLFLAQQVRITARECIRQNREGGKIATPLQATVETHIRDIVGHGLYDQSLLLVDYYQAKKCLRH